MIVVESRVDVAFVGEIFDGVSDLLFRVSAFESAENVGDRGATLRARTFLADKPQHIVLRRVQSFHGSRFSGRSRCNRFKGYVIRLRWETLPFFRELREFDLVG